MMRSERSLKMAEEELDEWLFVRLDMKYIVNLSYVEGYHQGEVRIGDKKIKVARSRKKSLKRNSGSMI